MICSKCNGSIRPGPGTIERIRRGEIQYRHRICPRRLKAPKTKKYQLSKPRKLGWDKKRETALTTQCEVTGQYFATVHNRKRITYLNRVVDHIVAERLAVKSGKDPHARINLICIHANVHGRKRSAEDQLLKSGDMLTFLQELNRLDWPMDRVHTALRFYGLERELQDQDEPPKHTQENSDNGNSSPGTVNRHRFR